MFHLLVQGEKGKKFPLGIVVRESWRCVVWSLSFWVRYEDWQMLVGEIL